MFDYIFETKSATLLAAAAATWLAFLLVGNPRAWWRSLLFNYGPAFACAFFVVGNFYSGEVSGFDLLAGFLFEFSVLIASAKFFCDALKRVASGYDGASEHWLRWSLVLQLLAAAPLVAIDGAGIFSDGSRIAYFHDSSIARYLAYAGVLTAYVQAGLLAQRLSAGRSPGATGYAVVVAAFVTSTLSGSKGGVFLWLIATLALVDYRHIRIRWAPVLVALIAATAALWVTASVISETLGISELEFANMAVARFYLNNDARALAIDLGGQAAPFSDLVAASFRGLANLLGNPSNDPPLGLLLNERQTGLDTGNGPNASLIALIAYYSIRGYALLPALVSCVGVACVYAAVTGFRRIVRCKLSKMAASLIGIVLVQLLSQDFLAFPLGVVSACAAGLLFLVIDRKYARASTRRPAPPARLAAP